METAMLDISLKHALIVLGARGPAPSGAGRARDTSCATPMLRLPRSRTLPPAIGRERCGKSRTCDKSSFFEANVRLLCRRSAGGEIVDVGERQTGAGMASRWLINPST